MKKLTLVILAAALATTTAQAGWWRTYGGTDSDRGQCVQITSDGNYIISGVTWSFDYGSTWILKVDTVGDTLWSRLYDGGMSWYHWVEETSDGGYITTDMTKTDSDGNILWTQNCGIRSYCLDITDDGGYVITGDYGADEPIALIKTDSEGDTVWTREYLIDDWQRGTGYFVRQTSDGGYILTGEVGDTFFVQTQDKKPQAYLAFLMKTDGDGNIEWAYASGEYNSGFCVRETDDNGFIVGTTYGILKTDSNGDTSWFQSYGLVPRSIHQTIDGGYIVAGGKEGYLCLMKIDSNGDSIWLRLYGGTDSDVGFCVQQTEDNGYIVVGETWSFGAGDEDVYVLRTDSSGLLSIAEEPNSVGSMSWELVSSVGSQVVLRYWNHPQGFHARVFDVSGREVDVINAGASVGSLTWGNVFPSGVYFIQVSGNRKTSTEKIVLVK